MRPRTREARPARVNGQPAGQLITAMTDAKGQVVVTLVSTPSTSGTFTVWVDDTINNDKKGVLDTGEWNYATPVKWDDPPAPTTVNLQAPTASVPYQSQVTVSATVVDQYNHLMPGIPVTFSTNLGSFGNGNPTTSVNTGTNGLASATIASANAGTATITATGK